MRDEHRVLVDDHDRLGNIEQLQSLLAAGYDGPISYEPFSPVVHDFPDPKAELSRSFDFITNRLAKIAA